MSNANEGSLIAHQNWMRRALCLAEKAAHAGEVPVGAVVVWKGRVIGEAANCRESHANPVGHAEMGALMAAAAHLGRWQLNDCDLYVTLEPCVMCSGAIVLARIRRLIYAAPDPKAGACGSALDVLGNRRLNHRVQLVAGIGAQESKRLLRAFFQARRHQGGEVAEHG
ncbi:MAG: tRNA adenosine(34) deaminase TadA [Candidatus Zipacnadales bacterium]